jgi:hypothetical protein
MNPAEKNPLVAPWFGSWVIDRPGYSARVNEDGSLDFGERLIGDASLLDPVRGIGPYFTLDATDILMRIMGDDPYLSDKLALMDLTREHRAAIRARYDEDRMERALADLPAYLRAVWSESEWSTSTRRRILFELWDEAAEDGNELVVAGAHRARSEIARFIAAELPPGSRNAFTPSELTALNRARHSRASFAPYDAEPSHEPMFTSDAVPVTRLLAAF